MRPDAIAAGLNPLEPAPDENGRRFPLQTHANLVKALFIASFRSDEPFPQVLSAALTRVYEDAGWDLALGETVAADANPSYPNLADLQRAAIRIVQEVGYSQRITDDVLGFIKVRLSSLRLGTTGRFLQGGHQLDFGKLLRTNAVLEIEDVGDDSDKAFLMGTVLIRLVEHLRMVNRAQPSSPGGLGGVVPPGASGAPATLRHLTVIEEAHRLLRRPDASGSGASGGAAAHAVEMFAGLLAEIRAYGEGLIIAEQIPDRLIADVIKNTAVKITHRLPAADDRDAVGATMNMTQAQNRFLVTLKPGEAAVFADGMDFPLLAQMPDGTSREAATQAATATPAGVVRSRSITCGADCFGRPCTLRDMRVAQRALDEYPVIRLWAELSVLAHLVGWPMPVPRTALLSLLADDAVPVAGLRHLARRRCGPRRAGAGHRRAGQPGRPRIARQHRDQVQGLAGKLAVPAGGTQVARPRLQMDARPRRAQIGRQEEPGVWPASAEFGMGADVRAGDYGRYLCAPGGNGAALVRRRAA